VRVILIAAITLDGFIARSSKDKMEWSLDQALFKKQTTNHTVFIGSTTAKILSSSLPDRNLVVINRDSSPKTLLSSVKEDVCFVAGGARTNLLFFEEITDMFLTPHPLFFKKGLPLFHGGPKKIETKLNKRLGVDSVKDLYQYQYTVR
jgi:dihydrofolate reductase|tara:strand:+ start:1401 stop:1844 length:444 start_codon:yes stop_codon:yes gene_type:complete